MKTFQFLMLVTVLIVIDLNNIYAQTRKEVIESLTAQSDSLNKLLKSKTESLHKLELTLAKLEGASEANKSMFQLYNSRTDSLSKSLTKKDSLINHLKDQLTQLKTSLDKLKESQTEMTSKNEALQAELDTYKQNTETS